MMIETPRLILRNWREADVVPFARMNADPKVMEFFLDKLTQEESEGYYRRIADEFKQRGYGLYAVERKEDSAFIGYTGFHHFDFNVDFAPGVEIGWRLVSDCWNNGFATEAAAACLTYAAERLPFSTVWSFTSQLNSRSERVMQKIGMTRVKEFAHPLVPDFHPLKPHLLYRCDLRPTLGR